MNDTTEFLDTLEYEGDDEVPEDMTLAQYLVTIDRPVITPKGWMLETEGQADWALRRYAQYEQQAADVDLQADRLIAEINAWRTARKARYQRHLEYFTGKLKQWFADWRESHPKEKSCPLPFGTIGERAQQPEVIKDDSELVNWLEGEGLERYVKVKKLSDWATLKRGCDLEGDKAVYKPTGEEIPAVTLVQRPPAFYVKPAGLPAIVEGAEIEALDEPDIE